MRAILLAAGHGTRLRPLTDTIPKCLMPINGQPLLDIWLDRLTRSEVGPILINTHYLSELVREYVLNSRYANKVILANEINLYGTAGTLYANVGFYKGVDGMLIHADNYGILDLQEFILAHRNRPPQCLVTMMTYRTNIPSSCGIVELDRRGVVVNFHEKIDSPPNNLANGATYILSSEFISMYSTRFAVATDFSTQVLPYLMGRIYTYETKGAFIDIGTPETYDMANKMAST